MYRPDRNGQDDEARFRIEGAAREVPGVRESMPIGEPSDLPSRPLPEKAPLHDRLAELADGLEADLRRGGYLVDDSPPPPFRAAFGADAMPFLDWVGKVLLPRLREFVKHRAPLPGPGVGAYAVRELDGYDQDEIVASIVNRLCTLDQWCRESRGGLRGSLTGLVERSDGIRVRNSIIVLVVAAVLATLGIVAALDLIDHAHSLADPGILEEFEVANFGATAAAPLRLRLDLRQPPGAPEQVRRVELLSLATPARFGPPRIVPPLVLDPDEPPPRAAIENWLASWQPNATDAARHGDFSRIAALVRGLDTTRGRAELDAALAAALAPHDPGKSVASFPYPGRASPALQNTILVATIAIFLAPLIPLALRLRRRLVRESR
jgi:uncharacterized protein YqcC (DUF446 family)